MSVAVSPTVHPSGQHRRAQVVTASLVVVLAVVAVLLGVWFTSTSSGTPAAPAVPAVAEPAAADGCAVSRVVTAC